MRLVLSLKIPSGMGGNSKLPVKRGHPHQRGSIALAALTALVVVLIIGLGLLTLGGNARLGGKRAMRLNGAQAQALAGIEYGYWQRTYNSVALPYTNTRTLGNGKFTVTVTDNSSNTAGTMQIVSTGTQSGDSVKLTRILPVKKTTFDYALCSNANVSISSKVTTGASSANGDVRVNGNLSLSNLTSVVNGDAMATGSVSTWNTTGTNTANGAALTFPTITSSYYQGLAIATYNGNQTFSGSFTLPGPTGGYYPIVVINGNVTIGTGTITGIGTVLVTGTITFTGSMSYLYTTDHVAFLCLGNIVDGAAAGTSITEVGYYYAHNSTSSATFQQTNTGTMTLSGGMTADAFNVTGPLVSKHDPAMNAALGTKMRLPGY